MPGSIPYNRPTITEADRQAVLKVLDSGWIAGGGPVTRQFEHKLEDVTGFRYAIAVSSGTAALYIAIGGWYGEDRIEWLRLPSLTFMATVNMVVARGHHPLFVDINPLTMVAEGCDLSVSYAGYPVADGSLLDAAHWLVPGLRKFTEAGAVTLSFHAIKAVACGEGGAILTDSTDLAECARQMRDHGRKATDSMVRPSGNYRMSDMQAALGLSQLERLGSTWARRGAIAMHYLEHWHNEPRLKLPVNHYHHGWHLFTVRLTAGGQDAFRQRLEEQGVGTQVCYRPVHTLDYYERRYGKKYLPETERAASSLVCLPLYAGMTDEEVEYVIKTVDEVLGRMEGAERGNSTPDTDAVFCDC